MLRRLQINDVIYLVDGTGQVIPADHRVWKPLTLTTLALDFWPPALTGPVANGRLPFWTSFSTALGSHV